MLIVHTYLTPPGQDAMLQRDVVLKLVVLHLVYLIVQDLVYMSDGSHH